MEDIQFLVQGSASEPYKVRFEKSGRNVNAFCTCPAGANGQYCKHRFNIMAASRKGIVSANGDLVATVKSWLQGSDIEQALSELAEAEHEHEQAKARLKKAKIGIAAAMRA